MVSVNCAVTGLMGVSDAGGVKDIGAQAQSSGSLAGDRELVAGDHLDIDAHLPGGGDRRLGVLPGRIEKRQHAEELPLILVIRPGHAEGSKAALREPFDGVVDRRS